MEKLFEDFLRSKLYLDNCSIYQLAGIGSPFGSAVKGVATRT